MNLVRGYTRRTEWSSVLEWCNAAIDVGSKDCKAYLWRAIALGRHAKWEEADAALQDFLSVGGDANLAGRTRNEWERARAASEERESAGNKDVDSSAPKGIRQRSLAQAQTAAESSSVGGCPFSGTPASSSAGAGCPFSGAPASSSQRCPFSAPAPAAPVVPELDARTVDAVSTVIAGATGPQVRVLGSNLQEKLHELLEEDPDLCCPISLMLLSDPVLASDGFVYEKASLEQILKTNATSPFTRQKLTRKFLPAKERMKMALEFRETRSKELLAFASESIEAGHQHMASEAAERVLDYIMGLAPGSCATIESKLRETYARLGRTVPDLQRGGA